MFDKEINILSSKPLTIQDYIELLERLFIFEDDYWKKTILNYANSSHKYHFHFRINNLNLLSAYNKEEKIVVKTNSEVWDRDDDDGTDFVLVLTIV